MTLSNSSPAQRIVAHEQEIASNIQQIKANEGLIETQELAHKDLLTEQVELDNKNRSFREFITRDDSLETARETQKEAISHSRDETSALKQDTFQLKEDTYTEKELLKSAHADEQALHQENIADLEENKNRSEDRLNRLENYDETDPTKTAAQAENIEQEQAVLAKRKQDLAEAKESAENAKEAAQARDAKVADDVQEACPLKCEASQLAIKSNNGKRKYQMATPVNQSSQTLKVISLSQAGVNAGKIEPPVSVISVAITGHCEKGKTSNTALSKDEKQLQRRINDQYCPVVKIDQGPIKVEMPADSTHPLNFQAFCPDPPTGLFSWGYLFKNMFLASKREHATYTLETEGCDGSYALVSQVEAYPKIKAEIGVSIGYKPTKDITKSPNWEADPNAVDKVADYNKGHRTVEVGNWVFNLDLKGSVDHVNLAYQLEYLNPNDLVPKLRKALNLFIFIFDVIRICCDDKMGSNIFEKAGAIVDAAQKETFDETGLVENDKPGRNSDGKAIDGDASGPTGSIAINYPKISFAIGYENCEAVGKPTLGSATSLQLKLDPLIGVTGKVDILGALIQIGVNGLIPGAGLAGKTFVEYIWPILKGLLPEDTEVTKDNIDKRKYYLEAGVALVMNVGANVTAEGKWTHHNDGENLTNALVPLPDDPVNNPVSGAFSGMVGASLEMHLEGKAYAKGKAWAVTFEAGLIIAVGSAKEIGATKLEYKVNITKQNEQMMVDGAFEWNGLAIITASYRNAGIESKDNNDATNATNTGLPGAPPPKEKTAETKYTFSDKDLKNKWVLIEPGKTPNDTKPVPLNDYFNS